MAILDELAILKGDQQVAIGLPKQIQFNLLLADLALQLGDPFA